jgi:hypothetical protein
MYDGAYGSVSVISVVMVALHAVASAFWRSNPLIDVLFPGYL